MNQPFANVLEASFTRGVYFDSAFADTANCHLTSPENKVLYPKLVYLGASTNKPQFYFDPAPKSEVLYKFMCGAAKDSLFRPLDTLRNEVEWEWKKMEADTLPPKVSGVKTNSKAKSLFPDDSLIVYFNKPKLDSLTETFYGRVPWLAEDQAMNASAYKMTPKNYSSSRLRYTIWWTVPYEFEVTNPVAGTGYRRTIYPAFTTDACLLDRAEAKIMLRDFNGAMDDLNLWATNMFVNPVNITPEQVNEFYKAMDYYTWFEPTPKKHLNPAFQIDAEGSVQESMLQYVLHSRRIETMGFGIRWFDIKRYGIKIYRRVSDGDGVISSVTDSLEVNDLRRAVQIPLRVRDAGFEANKR